MKLAEFIEALEKASSKYMSRLRILVKTENAVKARIEQIIWQGLRGWRLA
jgi:hypothetical protein